MNVLVNFDASGYKHEDLLADSTVYMSIDAPVQKLSPFSVMHPFRFTFTIYLSTQLLLYIYIQIYLEINVPLYHDAFLPANHEDLPVD